MFIPQDFIAFYSMTQTLEHRKQDSIIYAGSKMVKELLEKNTLPNYQSDRSAT